MNGKKLGVGKKQFFNKKSSLDICKRLLLENYVDFVSSNKNLLDKFDLTKETISKLSYKEAKVISKTYQENLMVLKKDYFKQWTEKDSNLKSFTVLSDFLENDSKS